MRFAHVATAIVSLAGLPLALAQKPGPATDACGPNFCKCCFYSSPSESYYGFYHTSGSTCYCKKATNGYDTTCKGKCP
ncbi:uncharacterized protein MYCGRDRAFT_101652 [Zymoseptoria tritici IPO323]|uniref:AvrStb6 n=1 Tax=Zymoseptoria tritici (strain CBS 115943 / IPO323) TaxID=336722 RepID=F9XM50_ZYMTI|nr:uncharacterized protein MYCGRDRAFT_101652 [Zymoseptoria tritici IPO323]EGP83425.1 hypothetical protein MYCGRDRAFT_101652 [Zymoseptoria tritici IPO323]